MRTIPSALLWEVFVRGRWQVPGYFLLGILMPMLVYAALSSLHAIDQTDQAFVTMHFAFLPLIMFEFAVGIVGAQGKISRLFLSPVSTKFLVAWHMFPGGIFLGAEVGFFLLLQNLLFRLSCPIAGPALFAATVWSTSQLLVCVTHRSVRGVVVALLPPVLMFGWLQSRHGGWLMRPTRYWAELTLTEIVFLLSIMGLSYLATVIAVSKDRCGEEMFAIPRWRGFSPWREGILKKTENGLRFLDSRQALLWHEWHCRGTALPTIYLGLTVIPLTITVVCAVVARDLHSQLNGAFALLLSLGVAFPCIAGLCSFVPGSLSAGFPGRQYRTTVLDSGAQVGFDQMGHFSATRPVTNRLMGEVVLQTLVKSLASAWLVWVSALGVVLLAMKAGRITPERPVTLVDGTWYLSLTFLGAWITMANSTACVLSGRSESFAKLLVAFISGFVVLSFLAGHFLSPQTQNQLAMTLLSCLCLAIFLSTLLGFSRAATFGLVTESGRNWCVAVWLGICALGVALKPADLPQIVLVLIPAFAALVILPMASIPLAIQWNRHR